MSDFAHVAVSAASLTAEEVAACYRRGVSFTDLVILMHHDGQTFGRTTTAVTDALNNGAPVVWLLDYGCDAITIYPSGTHLRVLRGEAELTMPEFTLFRCRVKDFYRMLGFALQPPS